MTIKWEDSYSVGISSIDEQHKIFFSLMNEVTSSYYEKKSLEVMEKIFKELFDYANYHFSTEERYFEEFKYEGAPLHIEEHKNYIKRLSEIQTKLSEDHTKAAVELVDFMEDWFVHHINLVDKQYTECFQEHGLK